mmetsp:Transcript_17314/g.25806  ORF Transcript_17314/g.25806 Transcript_17314/m.25806 type:complete len:295 (-) Transcript_17314:3125-4009(-)
MRDISLPLKRSMIVSILFTFLGSYFSKSSKTFPRISSTFASLLEPSLLSFLALLDSVPLPLDAREDVGLANFDGWFNFGTGAEEDLGEAMRDCITCAFRALMLAADEASFAFRISLVNLLISLSFSCIFLSNSSPSLCTFRSFCCSCFNSFCTFSKSCTCSSRLAFSFCQRVVISALLLRNTSIARFSSWVLDLVSALCLRRSWTRSFSRFKECIWFSDRSFALESNLISDVKFFTVSSRFLEVTLRCAVPRLIRRTRVANLRAHCVSSYELLVGHTVTTIIVRELPPKESCNK